MLIISNGAFKSGSTWLFNILRSITDFSPLPEEYLNPDWVNPSIHPEKLATFLHYSRHSKNDYLAKNHFRQVAQRDLILSHDHVYVLDIQRGLRDVVVSAYHHNRLKSGYKKPFLIYYWRNGRFIADSAKSYHEVWGLGHPKVYVTSYEKLKTDFTSETKAIGAFLGINLSEQKIKEIRNKTSLESLRERYGEQDAEQKFFRKGEIGDWKNYFDPLMLADIRKIEEKGLSNYNFYDKMLPKLMSYITKIVSIGLDRIKLRKAL